MTEPPIRVRMSDPNSRMAYVALPGRPVEPVPGCIARTVDLIELIKYTGPRIHLDFNEDSKLIGIEIIVSMREAGVDETEEDEDA